MKKLGKLLTTLLLVVVSLTAICAVTACDFDSSEETEYTIVFQDKDGAELKTVTVKEGVVPEYTDELPALPANTAEFTYSWKWDKEFVAATANATYKLVLNSVKNKYEIKFMNEDEQVGETQTIEYGTAAIAPADPTKAGTEDESYVFDGWYTAAEGGDKVTDFTVKGAATYYARYNLVRNYTVKFVSEGVELQSSKVASGTIPEYKGATPTKQATAQFTYTFKGWDKKIVAVTGDVTYTATFDETTNKYTVKFVSDGVELQSTEVEYGTTPEYKGETPTRQATAQFTYTFKGWDKEIAAVKGDVTYTATFDETTNQYTITLKNGETVLKTLTLDYGSTVEVPEDVKVEGYEILGWEPEFETVTENAEYTAIVARILKQADKDNFAAIIAANPDDNYILGEDIDFANGSTGFVLTFGGMLDGRGHKLKNIKLGLGLANAKPDANDWVYAFIGENAGTIKNIGFYYTIPDALGNFRASIVRSNSGLMENIYVKINLGEEAPHESGALAGQNTSYGTIKNVIANWSGTVNANAGPIVGGELGGTIKNAYAIRNGVFVSGNNNYNNPYNAADDKDGVLIGTYENCKNYDDMAALVAELDLTAAGWSSYWSVKDGKVIFGEEDPEPVDDATILTQENMANFADILKANPNGKYALGSDIDFGGKAFVGKIIFGGMLDGRGFALKNFTLNFGANSEGGWNAYTFYENNGTIKNLILDYTMKDSPNNNIAFIMTNKGTIENVYVNCLVSETINE
ncbi:MAG: InlB B-repeat-containing protein, partial [Christensenellaceae bacterium]|nr:InlB B-repeat-containing protein [Christensenellaceae bacterium]